MRIELLTREDFLPTDVTAQFSLSRATHEQARLICGADVDELVLGDCLLALEHEWTVIRLSIDNTPMPTYTIVGISSEEYPNRDDA